MAGEYIKICPQCGMKVQAQSVFCDNCGTNLKTVSVQRNTPERKNPPTERFCPKCGRKIPTNVQFCRYCGATLKQSAQRQQNNTPPQNMNRGMQQTKNTDYRDRTKKKSKMPVLFGCIAAALVVVLITGFVAPGFFLGKDHDTGNEGTGRINTVTTGYKPVESTITNKSEGGSTFGSIQDSGFTLYVENDIFEDGSTISGTPISEEQLARYGTDGKYQYIGSPVDITCNTYDDGIFTGDVILTMPIPDKDATNFKPGEYYFSYYDEKTGTIQNLWPDSYDLENGLMSVELPHFTPFWVSKPTREELINKYLDDYSTKMAMARLNREKTAAEMEPYLKAKIEAMGLTKKAAADFLQAALGKVSSGWSFEGDGSSMLSGAVNNGTNAALEVFRGVMEDDGERASGALESYTNNMLMSVWDEMEYSKRLDEVVDSEFAGTGASTVLSNASSLARLAAYISEGEYTSEEVKQEISGILQSIHPAAELTTKGVAFVSAAVNQTFTIWKSNKVDELYRVYKEGNDVVDPGDKDSFLDWLVAGKSFFGIQKGVSRFYNMDKASEIFQKYNWKESSYEELSEEKRRIFDREAENSLIEYFEYRKSQEDVAEQIKQEQLPYIEEMLNPDTGALCSGKYEKFFGEPDEDYYDVTARLERLSRLHEHIMQFVNEDELKKSYNRDAGINEGTIMNWYVECFNTYPRDEAIEEFKNRLEDNDLLDAKYIPEKMKQVVETADVSIFDDGWDIDTRKLGYASGAVSIEKHDPEKRTIDKECDYEFEVLIFFRPEHISNSYDWVNDYDWGGCCYDSYDYNANTGTLTLYNPDPETFERLEFYSYDEDFDVRDKMAFPIPNSITIQYAPEDLYVDFEVGCYITRMTMTFNGNKYTCYDNLECWLREGKSYAEYLFEDCD